MLCCDGSTCLREFAYNQAALSPCITPGGRIPQIPPKTEGIVSASSDRTTLSRRNRTVNVCRSTGSLLNGLVHFIMDSTGLKICGQGERLFKKHRKKLSKRYRAPILSVFPLIETVILRISRIKHGPRGNASLDTICRVTRKIHSIDTRKSLVDGQEL